MNCNQVRHEYRIKAGRVMLKPLQQFADNDEGIDFVTTMGINRNT